MVELLISASLVAAFIAGIAALFAPCCITVLLPAYLGSIFRQKRTVLLMTFVFFLGLLLVFLPLGFGIAFLGQFFSQYHNTIFVTGGIFLLLLGTSILLGMHFSLPFFNHPKVKVKGAGSIFVLGIFSGFATLCCAPVLAGVLALSVMPGSIFWGGIYALAYVLGMVAPLFIIAYFIDKTDLSQKTSFFQKQISYSAAGKKIEITFADVLSGVTFLLMGGLIIYLAKAGKLAMGPSNYQTNMNILMSNLTTSIESLFVKVPFMSWLILFIIILAIILTLMQRKRKKVN